ncbi:GNAT family N-acetyltransferase [Nocardiopsis endophytica]
MQRLAQQVTALRPDLVNGDASYGELAWNQASPNPGGTSHRHRIWTSGGEPVAWGWARLPRRVRLSDGSVRDVTGASLAHQVHPDHPALVDEVIAWFDETAAGLERSVVAGAADVSALERWAAHGYGTDPDALGDTGSWTQLNERDLTGGVERPRLPDGHRFLTADEAGPEAAVRAHVDAWAPSAYTLEAYERVRSTAAYRGDLHVLVEAPDGTMAASTIMWLDEANATAEFEPVGTHPAHRRRGLARAMLLHGMHLARAAGAEHMTVACLGADGHSSARELYYGVGFRAFSRDAPLTKPATA